MDNIDRIISWRDSLGKPSNSMELEAEGGCGVIGVASSKPVEGKYLIEPLTQMRNRGNGKGGGIAAVGLSKEWFNVSEDTIENSYLLEVAYLNENVINDLEEEYIYSKFNVEKSFEFPALDYKSLGLLVEPPKVKAYFARPKDSIIKSVMEANGLNSMDLTKVKDEFVYQNSFMINKKFYSSLGDKNALVLSHGKNMIVMKMVGYAEDVIKYYNLENLKANVWIGHHRYPTKGVVFHPGGAHPFIGVNHALVHNGDFSNYKAMRDYLQERNMHPLFLTDTEVAALLFDLYDRVYDYPLEYLIEAMAPTTERDFEMLPKEKKEVYRAIQKNHIRGSPDGPWFFITAGNSKKRGAYELIGITDTSMLRPQIFALLDDKIELGVIASERQVVNSYLRGLQEEGVIDIKYADKYWNARGGSYTDGGAFIFSVDKVKNSLACFNKFGGKVEADAQW